MFNMSTNNYTKLDSMTIAEITLTVVPLPFCINTLIVLVYFIRRVIKLRQELKNIPLEKLIKQEYINYVMNMKIHLKISGFIIVILIFELFENVSFILFLLPNWGKVVDAGSSKSFRNISHSSIRNISNSSMYFAFSTRLMYIPLLSLVMNFLWLVYRKYEYKYTLIRWTVYIVIRGLVVVIWLLLSHYMSWECGSLAHILLDFFYMFLYVFDFIQYVYYSKRFYSHLKSREKEIRLFYFDREAYLYHKCVRVHFLVSNILVTSALFLFTLGFSISNIIAMIDGIVRVFDGQDYSVESKVTAPIDADIALPIIILYKILINLNYLYIIVVIIFKYLRDRNRLYHINRHIMPFMEEYRNSIYNRYM